MGRPDMAYFKFADTLRAGGTIGIYNMGDCRRGFTYVDDIVEGVVRVVPHVPAGCGTGARCRVYNVGNFEPVQLLEFVDTLQRVLVGEGGPACRLRLRGAPRAPPHAARRRLRDLRRLLRARARPRLQALDEARGRPPRLRKVVPGVLRALNSYSDVFVKLGLSEVPFYWRELGILRHLVCHGWGDCMHESNNCPVASSNAEASL